MPKAVFVSSGLFYSSCSKATEREKETCTVFPQKRRKTRVGSLLPNTMNTATEYRPFVSWLQQTPGGLVLALNPHLLLRAFLLWQLYRQCSQHRARESDLLSAVGFSLLSKLKKGFLVCNVLTCLEKKYILKLFSFGIQGRPQWSF